MALRSAPGFRWTLGATLLWLGLIVLAPLGSLFVAASELTPAGAWRIVSAPRALAAYRLTFGAALIAALANGAIGFLIAWVLERRPFPGRRLVDALIDIPFALPTAVAGLTYASLYGEHGWIGRFLAPLGIRAVHNPPAIVLVLTFVSLPFVVRTLQPVIESLGVESEEAARSLGASRGQTFRWVVFPSLLPALLTGMTLAFARAVGEYGSIVFVSGNIPYETEIASLLIVGHLEEYDFAGASAVAVVLLSASLAINGAVTLLSRWGRRHDA